MAATALFMAGLASLISPRAYAGLYGEEGEARVSIKKEVRRDNEGDFVEQISGLLASEGVEFRIEVENTGSITLEDLDVRDYLPDGLELVSSASSWVITSLDPGEKVIFFVEAAVAQSVAGVNEQVCLVNVAEALGETDSAVVCVSGPKPKVPITATELPESGPASDLAVSYSVLGLGFGILLRRIRK